MRILLQFARTTRHPRFPAVPTARELAQSESARSLIELAEIPYSIDRPFAAPPQVPAARAKALQEAFIAAHKDSQYLDEAARLGIDISPVGNEEVQRALDRIAATPPATLDAMRRLLAKRGSGQ